MPKRKKRGTCLRCATVTALEKVILRKLTGKRPQIAGVRELVDTLAKFEDRAACKCGRGVIAGERVGALLDHVS